MKREETDEQREERVQRVTAELLKGQTYNQLVWRRKEQKARSRKGTKHFNEGKD